MAGGMLTHGGRLITTDAGTTVPSIPDLGLALSRVPRFGGHTRRWWTVAHHTLWLADYAKQNGHKDRVQLGILLHDAHEAITGDIPTHFKTADMKEVQRRLDKALYQAYAQDFYLNEDYVKYYDRLGLYAEAAVVGPPSLAPDQPGAPALFREHFMGRQPDPADVTWLERWITFNTDITEENNRWGINVRQNLQDRWVMRVVELL